MVLTDTAINNTSLAQTSTATSNAKVYIASSSPEAFTVASSGVTIIGGSGREVISINAGVNTVTFNQNIDRVNLPGPSSDFSFKQAGNQLLIYDSVGSSMIATVTVQGDIDGTQIGFNNGVYDAKLTKGSLAIGGSIVSSSAIAKIAPTTPTSTVEPTPSASSSATVYLDNSGAYTAANSGVKVIGNNDKEVLSILAGVNGISFNQNIEQLKFTDASSKYKFLQTGNQINIYDVSGTNLLAKGAIQNDADGTLLSFTDGTGSVLLGKGIMTLGGLVVSNSAPTPIIVNGAFNLTSSLDKFTGTANAEIFKAEDGTLQTYDILDGGAGLDVLNAAMGSASGAAISPTIANIETINLTISGNQSFDLKNTIGLTTLNVVYNSPAAGTASLINASLVLTNSQSNSNLDKLTISGDALSLSFTPLNAHPVTTGKAMLSTLNGMGNIILHQDPFSGDTIINFGHSNAVTLVGVADSTLVSLSVN